jgi:transforming growth factor-beta-induced protein
MRINFLKFFTLIAVLTTFVACSKDDDDNGTNEQNIVELAVANQELSTLVAAVTRAGLVETLSGEGPFTVFAPTNQAFTAFLANAGFSSLEQVPDDVLTQILLNHVIGGDVRSTNLQTGYGQTVATFGNQGPNLSIFINTQGGVSLNGVSNVINADIVASNGVVHVVDAVIGLPTVTTFAASNPEFSILVQALTRSDLSTNYATVLSGDGPFTVFAPTNAAFAAALEELQLTNLNDIPAAVLEAILLYHVVGGANVRAGDLSDGQQVATLNTQSFTVNLSAAPSITDARGRTANIVATDVQGANGVVHVIDRVILPQD